MLQETGAQTTQALAENAEPAAEGAATGAQETLVDGATAMLELSPIEAWLERTMPFYAQYKWLQVLTLVLLSVLAASFVSWFLKRVVARLLAKTETTYDDQMLSALTPPIYISVISLGFRLALIRLDLSETVTARFAHILGTLVVLMWLIAGIQIAGLLVRVLAESSERVAIIKPTTAPLFDNLSKIGLVLLAAYLVINIWGGDISALLAAGGIAGLAIGFAARDTLANLFAGIFIFADSPYKVGDFINLDSGERGQVTSIGLRSTRLLTRDDVEVTIPNSIMGGAKIVNESGGPHLKYRIRVKIGVAYGADLDQVEALLLDIAETNSMVCEDPEPRVRFRTFGESSLDLELLCWIEEPVLRGRVTHALNKDVYKRLNEERIEIPYPKRDIYIKEQPEP